MVALGAPVASHTFLALFGTPTLLSRVLHSIGYAKPPRYFWSEVVTKEEEVKSCEDDHGDGVPDIDSDHPKE